MKKVFGYARVSTKEQNLDMNQRDMLCRNSQGYFYEFVPGWFNDIRVEQYTFTWRMSEGKDYTLRGRGFLTGYGYHVHTYGRPNPYDIRARDKHMAEHGSGGRSGACACAGGGRAGCSQKDTFDNKNTEAI